MAVSGTFSNDRLVLSIVVNRRQVIVIATFPYGSSHRDAFQSCFLLGKDPSTHLEGFNSMIINPWNNQIPLKCNQSHQIEENRDSCHPYH